MGKCSRSASVLYESLTGKDEVSYTYSNKFSLQDATLAAAYSQLAAHALGFSTIWIGMIDELRVMKALSTDLTPSSILCIGYPKRLSILNLSGIWMNLFTLCRSVMFLMIIIYN